MATPPPAVVPAATWRGKLKPAYLTIAAVATAFIALGASILSLGYQRQEEAAFTNASNLTLVIVERLESALRRADNDLRSFTSFLPLDAMDAAEAPRFRRTIEEHLRVGVEKFPEIMTRTVVDAHGISLYRFGSNANGTSFADREWFKTLRDNPQTTMVISDAIPSRATGRPLIVMARAIRDRDGRFLGTANASLNLDVFGKMLESLDVGSHGLIVVRRKGVDKIVLRFPFEARVANMPVSTQISARINAGEKSGRHISISPVDGIERALVYRALEEYPFSVSVGLAKMDYLHEWKRSANIFGVLGSALLVFMIAFVAQRVRSEARLAAIAASLDRSKAELRSSEKFLRAVIESTSEGILVEDTTGRAIATNRRLLTMWNVPQAIAGLADRKLLGRHMSMMLENPDRLPLSVSASQDGDILKYPDLDLLDGRRIALSVSKLTLDSQLSGYVWSFHDLTERKLTDNMHCSIIESAADAFVAFDAGLRITGWSLRAEQIFGREARAAISKPIMELLPDAKDRNGVVQSLLRIINARNPANERTVQCLQARRADRTEFPAEIQISGFRMGDAWQYTSFIRDISTRVAAEQQLVQTQKLQTIGQLTGGLAHDFNNLLNIILGSLDLLEVKRPENVELRDAALNAARRGSEVTKSLLAVARRKDLAPRDVNLDTIIRELEPLLRQTAGKRVDVAFDLSATNATVNLDTGALNSALLNLVINARDAMPEGGTLTISTSQAMSNNGADAHDRFQGISIKVTDTGCGMTAEIAAKACEPFFTTKPRGRGAGLGLAMVYGFAKRTGGKATIDSKPGAGTTIELLLPAQEVTLNAVPDLCNVDIHRHGETVLIVDNAQDLAAVAKRWLTELGYRASIKTSPQRALARIQHETFDALVSDIDMPGAMNGVELAEQAVRSRPGIAIVLATGFLNTINNLDRTGFAVIDKPYSKKQLGTALAARIKRKVTGEILHTPGLERAAA